MKYAHIHAYKKEVSGGNNDYMTLVADKLFYYDSDNPQGHIIELPGKDGNISYWCLS